MKLTHIACKNAELREKAYKLTDGGGLYLYVMPNGSKYWHFKYSYAGKIPARQRAAPAHP